jgi:hypothetical protein
MLHAAHLRPNKTHNVLPVLLSVLCVANKLPFQLILSFFFSNILYGMDVLCDISTVKLSATHAYINVTVRYFNSAKLLITLCPGTMRLLNLNSQYGI